MTQKVIHKRYWNRIENVSENWPNTLTQGWATNIFQKLFHKRYSKKRPPMFLKIYQQALPRKRY